MNKKLIYNLFRDSFNSDLSDIEELLENENTLDALLEYTDELKEAIEKKDKQKIIELLEISWGEK